MKIDFILPDIGEGIVECELVEWRVQEGDPIAEDQPVSDVMTDKALVEITAMHTGVVSKLYYQKGDIVKVHQPLFEIEVADEQDTETAAAGASEPPKQTAATPDPVAQTPTSDIVPRAPALDKKALASPAVRRLAREHNLDLNLIEGTGRDGRVLKEDILRAQQTEHKPAQPSAPPSTLAASRPGTQRNDRTEPIRGVQAAMARQMTDAARSIPHFTYADEFDVTALEAVRQSLKPGFAEQDIKLSLLPFFIKALELAIRQYPILNSRLNPDCTELTYLADVNIGMAADTPNGLLVPNIKQVQDRSLQSVAAEVQRLAEQARAGRLAAADMQGGTISVSNIGALGGTVATPIVNKPEVAIVALGRVQSLPRFAEDGSVTARKIMTVSWSGDHRVIDGATMARFCNCWKAYLEQPMRMLADLS